MSLWLGRKILFDFHGHQYQHHLPSVERNTRVVSRANICPQHNDPIFSQPSERYAILRNAKVSAGFDVRAVCVSYS